MAVQIQFILLGGKMSIISIFSGIYSNAESIIKEFSDEKGFEVVSDSDILIKAAQKFQTKPELMNKFR